MACIEDLHVGDIGTIIRATLQDTNANCVASALNVSSATTITFTFKKPDGSKITRNGGFTTDGSDGKVQYTTVEDDLDQDGEWRVQLYLVLSSGSWRSEIGRFKVIDNL
jgi:hypothetical protein